MSAVRLWGLFALSLHLLLTACGPSGSGRPLSAAEMPPRADPGYVQWLERQAFLGTANEYTGIVSGSELLWRAPSEVDSVETLLTAAPTWLLIHPPTLLTAEMRPVLAELADPAVLGLLKEMQIHGLYIAPSDESGTIWEYRRERSSTGEDITSPVWAAHMGTDKDFHHLARLAEQQGLQLGGDLVPAATGLGPDFFLAARNVREYPGCYVMVEIPADLWSLLPPARQEWIGTPLTAAQTTALAAQDIVPPALARDALGWTTPGGWAVTGEVPGSDGVRRRWAYRYHGTPDRPVLNWDDPSGAGRKIFSAAAIRQIGLLRQTLGGLRMEALFGLDAAAASPDVTPTSEPALSALRALSREIRRYGGWSIQRDPLPPEITSQVLQTGVDFTADTITTPAAEYALLTGDTGPLRKSLVAAIADHVDQRRIWRTLPATDGLPLKWLQSPRFGADAPYTLKGALMRRKARKDTVSVSEDTLYATAATLSALAADAPPNATADDATRTGIRQRHLLLTTFRAGLPGLLLLSGQDLAGTLNISFPDASAPATRGAWRFFPSSGAVSTRQGIPLAPTAYPPPLEQMARDDSYVRAVARLSALRNTHRIALGTVTDVGRSNRPGSVAVLTRLPDGDHLLTVANFSAASGEETVTFSREFPARRARGLLRDGDISTSGHSVHLMLFPWECRLILFSSR